MKPDLTNYPERSGVLLFALQWAGTVMKCARKDIAEGRPHLAAQSLDTELGIIKRKLSEIEAADAEIARRVSRPLAVIAAE